jgi:hypothetical protein
VLTPQKYRTNFGDLYMTREENDRRNDIRIEREEAFFRGVGHMLVITFTGLLGVVIYAIPWQATAFVAAAFALPVFQLVRCIWQQRNAS